MPALVERPFAFNPVSDGKQAIPMPPAIGPQPTGRQKCATQTLPQKTAIATLSAG
jgi:hypothetical protein